MAAALRFGEGGGDVLQVDADPGQRVFVQVHHLGSPLHLGGVVDRVCRVVAVPGRIEPLLGGAELVGRLRHGNAGVVERLSQLADLAGSAGLDGVVDLPGITPGGAGQFGDTQVDQRRIV